MKANTAARRHTHGSALHHLMAGEEMAWSSDQNLAAVRLQQAGKCLRDGYLRSPRLDSRLRYLDEMVIAVRLASQARKELPEGEAKEHATRAIEIMAESVLGISIRLERSE